MAIKTIDQLRALFKNGDTPNQQAFYDLFDSFRHINGKITGSDLSAELYSVISALPPADAYTQLLAMVQGKVSLQEVLSAIEAAKGTSIAPLTNGKIPETYIPDVLSAAAQIDEDFTTNITVGGIASGTLIEEGESVASLVKSMLTTVYYPAITEPSFALTSDMGALRKIGTSVNVGLTFNFYRGNVLSVWSSVSQGGRAGAATGYTFMRADNTLYAGQPQAGNQYTASAYTVAQGGNLFKAKVAYAQGVQPVDSSGEAFGTPLAAGESIVVSTSFEGVYPLLATNTAIATATELALASMILGNNIEINLVAESGGNKQAFWVPAAWITARALQSVQYFNTVSNTYDTSNKLNDFVSTDVMVNEVAYKKYTNQTSDRGALKIKLLFP